MKRRRQTFTPGTWHLGKMEDSSPQTAKADQTTAQQPARPTEAELHKDELHWDKTRGGNQVHVPGIGGAGLQVRVP